MLFKEIPNPGGDLPVSVPGVGYDLIIATSPDASQNIPLGLNLPEWIDTTEIAIAESISLPEYRLGDTIPLRTGIILDMNGHAVPNNTPAEFIITINGEETPAINVTTKDGIAQVEYLVDQSGTISIHVQSGLATSEALLFEIPYEEVEIEPTATPLPTEAPPLVPTPTLMVPTPTPEPEIVEEPQKTSIVDWLGALAVTSFVGWGATRTGAILGRVRWGIRWGLSAFIGGLVLYTYSVLKLPGSEWFMEISEVWGLLLATFMGAIIGWLIALVAYRSRRRYN